MSLTEASRRFGRCQLWGQANSWHALSCGARLHVPIPALRVPPNFCPPQPASCPASPSTQHPWHGCTAKSQTQTPTSRLLLPASTIPREETCRIAEPDTRRSPVTQDLVRGAAPGPAKHYLTGQVVLPGEQSAFVGDSRAASSTRFSHCLSLSLLLFKPIYFQLVPGKSRV